jgi:hypothetical protein
VGVELCGGLPLPPRMSPFAPEVVVESDGPLAGGGVPFGGLSGVFGGLWSPDGVVESPLFGGGEWSPDGVVESPPFGGGE